MEYSYIQVKCHVGLIIFFLPSKVTQTQMLYSINSICREVLIKGEASILLCKGEHVLNRGWFIGEG
jgi:hypothetical protein